MRERRQEALVSDNPYLGKEVTVTWNGGQERRVGERAVVVGGAFSSVVGWALKVKFDDGGTQSFPTRSLRFE